MTLHLAEISRQVARGAHAALVFDGAGYHLAKDLAVPDNITLVPLPPYAPGRVSDWRGGGGSRGVAVGRRLSPRAGASDCPLAPFPAPPHQNGS